MGKLKNGIPIISSDEIPVGEVFIIVAANHIHYREIERDIQKLGISRNDYVSVHTVLDNVADYFRKVYEAEICYPVDCMNRDDDVRIHQNGDICTCCISSQSIYGNLYLNWFKEIWESRRARISRLSLANHTYIFCDKKRCPFLSGVVPKNREEDKIPVRDIEFERIKKYPDSIAPEIDRSCNLYCKSCRKKVYIEKSMESDAFTELVLERAVPLPARLIINTVGEPFASKNCLRIIHDEITRKKGQISIYTNATLLFPKVIDEILEEYQSIELSVSVDAATEDTYKKLRRGGNWDKLMKNLNYCRILRQQGRITYFQMNFVVQTGNVHEMQAFADMAINLNADCIAMNAIENWGNLSADEYEQMSIVRGGYHQRGLQKIFYKRIGK